jgi:HlyD family secretion protein/adhesin transport system membrane fusion protein|tara:strand:+ start:4821 stop:6161 length:1341 start_codon:yes stop_codon:yes gene_type:complete
MNDTTDKQTIDTGKDLNDLTRSVLYEEVPNQNLMRLTALIIGVGFMLFLAWASVTNVNEVARAKGEIIPSGYAQLVQHLEGGIIAEILVEEGDLVEAGQVLVLMGGIGAQEDYAGLGGRQNSLQLQAERLRALAYDKEPDFAALADGDENAIAYQQRILDTARQASASERKVLEDQLAQKREMIIRLRSELSTAQNELKSGRELLAMKRDVEKRGSVSRTDLIESERDVNRLEGDVRSIESQISEGQNAISEYENRLTTASVRNRDQALQELEEVETQIAQNTETLGKLEGRVERMTVRAPVRGIIQELKVNTVGGVIGAGQPIMEIVPLDRTLIVEAHVAPRDIGNLQVHQIARVKVSAFDFSRYGVIEGTLDFLSATTFIDDNGESFYKGRITLDQNHVGPNPDKNLILPGMTVEADVVTGQKTVLAYLLKPVHTSLSSAFRER